MRASRVRERQAVEEAKLRAKAQELREQRAFTRTVEEIATALGETEVRSRATIERSVAVLGIEAAQALRQEVEALEAEGGMLTADGARRRTPGGIYLFLLKQNLTAANRKAELKKIIAG